MSETEIDLARTYLAAADHDPVGALIRSVRDLARARRLLASAGTELPARIEAPSPRPTARELLAVA